MSGKKTGKVALAELKKKDVEDKEFEKLEAAVRAKKIVEMKKYLEVEGDVEDEVEVELEGEVEQLPVKLVGQKPPAAKKPAAVSAVSQRTKEAKEKKDAVAAAKVVQKNEVLEKRRLSEAKKKAEQEARLEKIKRQEDATALALMVEEQKKRIKNEKEHNLLRLAYVMSTRYGLEKDNQTLMQVYAGMRGDGKGLEGSHAGLTKKNEG